PCNDESDRSDAGEPDTLHVCPALIGWGAARCTVYRNRPSAAVVAGHARPLHSYNDSMAILKVARMGHPVLRTIAKPIPPAEITSARVQRLIDDMFETMTEYSGIGLAGPQVHEPLRIFVAGVRDGDVSIPVDDDHEMPFMAVINPEITPVGTAMAEDWEGCLSIPDIRGRVVRPAAIDVT